LSCNAPGLEFDLADTNQRDCFDGASTIPCPDTAGGPTCESTAYCGQDAQHGWDTENLPTARFSRAEPTADEPVVEDNITRLIWQGCVAGLKGGDCTLGVSGTMDHAGALAYCNDLTWAGYADWRLPSPVELQSIVDYGRRSPAIDPVAFPATLSGDFLSSSSATGTLFDTRVVTFSLGDTDDVGSGYSFYIRCIRQMARAAPTSPARFVVTVPVADEPVVLDEHTQLEWQGCARGQSGSDCAGTLATSTWQSALAYCEGLVWGGHTDWHLPDIKELRSIVDERMSLAPFMDPVAFPAAPSSCCWSSSTFIAYSTWAWGVNFNTSRTAAVDKAALATCVRCARRRL
jgi:hypothetical protein